MFGVSFPELMLIGAVALIIVGPERLPGMLGSLGKWSNKLRRMLFDVRQQSGIDEILRAEGISGGLKEIRDLRNAVRGNVSGLLTAGTAPPRQGVQQLLSQARAAAPATPAPSPEVVTDPYADVPYDRTREYPDEGCDAYGAIPDDLWSASHPDPKPVSIAPQVTQPSTSTAAPPNGSPSGGTADVATATTSNPNSAVDASGGVEIAAALAVAAATASVNADDSKESDPDVAESQPHASDPSSVEQPSEPASPPSAQDEQS